MVCRHCEQPIKWGAYRRRWRPLDPVPHPEGRWVKRGKTYQFLFGVKLEMARWRNTPLLTEHTCLIKEGDHHAP